MVDTMADEQSHETKPVVSGIYQVLSGSYPALSGAHPALSGSYGALEISEETQDQVITKMGIVIGILLVASIVVAGFSMIAGSGRASTLTSVDGPTAPTTQVVAPGVSLSSPTQRSGLVTAR